LLIDLSRVAQVKSGFSSVEASSFEGHCRVGQ
jgi:hypothetical protein